ncbi:hypothetical protein J3R04_001418 [Spirilliplanes yamanashiensis]|nr:hypothetical protein [Spirilliplanes yamanashiensis]
MEPGAVGPVTVAGWVGRVPGSGPEPVDGRSLWMTRPTPAVIC